MRWTLPNILTLARICLTPVIALLPFIQGYWPKVIAFLIFLAASASDIVDGYLARRRNEVSELGQLLDPIADKLLLFATLIPIFWLTRHPTILVDYRIPWWGSFPVWVALLLVGRELLMTAFRFFAKRRGVVIPAMGAGKLKAVVQNVFIGATLFWFAWKDALAAHPFAGWFRNFWDKFHGAVVAVTLPNSRESESEADAVGTQLAARAGYDPRAAVTLWEKMGKLGGGRLEFLSTHPSPENRAAKLKEAAVKLEPEYLAAKASTAPAQRYVNLGLSGNERVVEPPLGANERVVKPAPGASN